MGRRTTGLATPKSVCSRLTLLPVIGGCGTIIQSKIRQPIKLNMDYTTTLTEHDPIAITIGNFDGIHKGHLRLMQELRSMAQALEAKPVLVTFDPHTLLVVRPGINLLCLPTLEE